MGNLHELSNTFCQRTWFSIFSLHLHTLILLKYTYFEALEDILIFEVFQILETSLIVKFLGIYSLLKISQRNSPYFTQNSLNSYHLLISKIGELKGKFSAHLEPLFNDASVFLRNKQILRAPSYGLRCSSALEAVRASFPSTHALPSALKRGAPTSPGEPYHLPLAFLFDSSSASSLISVLLARKFEARVSVESWQQRGVIAELRSPQCEWRHIAAFKFSIPIVKWLVDGWGKRFIFQLAIRTRAANAEILRSVKCSLLKSLLN